MVYFEKLQHFLLLLILCLQHVLEYGNRFQKTRIVWSILQLTSPVWHMIAMTHQESYPIELSLLEHRTVKS